MNLPFLQHRDSENSLFGLVSKRLVYMTEQASSSPAGAVEKKETIDPREVIKEDQEAVKDKINQSLTAYVHFAKNDEKINFDPSNPRNSLQRISEVRKVLEDKNKVNGLPDTEAERISAQLLFLDAIYGNVESFIENEYALDSLKSLSPKETAVMMARRRFRERFETISQGRDKLEAWKEKALYNRIDKYFQDLSKQSDFEGLWQNEHGIESNRQREARQLFISILSEQTNGFTQPVVFGENFTNDYRQNIRNYPFIYHEWVKERHQNVSPERIAELSSAISAAEREVEGEDDPLVIAEKAGDSAGINPEVYRNIPSSPESEKSAKRMELLSDWIDNLEEKAGEDNDNNDANKAKDYRGYAKTLKLHHKVEKARFEYFRSLERRDDVDREFTANNFANPTNQKEAIRLCMLKFQKSMEAVDAPLNADGNLREYYHPAVRRALITTVYTSGVGRYELDENGVENYKDNAGEPKGALLSALARSEFFNQNLKDRFLSPQRQEVLKVVDYGYQVAAFLEKSQEVGALIKLCVELQKAEAEGNEDKKNELKAQINRFPKKYVEKYTRRADIKDIQEKYLDDQGELRKFLTATQTLLENPESPESIETMQKIKAGTFAEQITSNIKGLEEIMIIKGPDISEYSKFIKKVDINFNAQEHAEKNDLKYFEHLGIRIEGVHTEYLSALKAPEFANLVPPLTYDNWGEYLRDPAKFDKLTKLLETILAGSPGQGKEDFITTFKSLKGRDDLDKISRSEDARFRDSAMALSVFELLRSHLQLRETTAGQADAQRAEIAKKNEGWNIGDVVSHHVGNAWEMLTGPGQDLSSRIAGGILIYGLYKAARKAMKGDDAIGKLLRVGFVAGAAEIFMKQTTGEGLLDRAGIDLLEDAYEGTYEGVLLQRGEKIMKENDVSDGEHERALENMRDVPFHVLMEWYDNTTPAGKERNPKQGQSGYKLPKGLSVSDIVRVDDPKIDKEQRACLVLRKSMENFFGYVGNKDDGRDANHGADVLRERWVKKVEDPKSEISPGNFWLPGVAKIYHGNQDKLTWAVVSASEIDPMDVERSKQQTTAGKIEEFAAETWDGFTEWASHYVGKIEGTAEEFFAGLGDDAQDTSKVIGDLVNDAGREARFFKNRVEIWYENHEYTIRRTATEHWEIITTGIKLPFKFIYGVDQMIMPNVRNKLKQIEQSFSHLHESAVTRNLDVADIVGNPQFEGSSDLRANPQYTYFGEYQTPFKKAFEAGISGGEKYHKANGIGYHISEVGLGDINVNNELFRKSPNAVRELMYKRSQEEAIDLFVSKGITLEKGEIERFMYPIHTVNKNTNPPKMYVFWRMPMPGSDELQKRQSGEWADHYDPNRFKDRQPFTIDPSKTPLENLKAAMLLDTTPVTRVVGDATSYLYLIPQLGLNIVEKGGDIIEYIAKETADNKEDKKKIQETINAITSRPESQRVAMDEFFRGAKDPVRAYSEFYKVPLHAKLYNFSLEFARDKNKKLFTGLLLGLSCKDKEGEDFTYDEASSTYASVDRPRKYYQDMMKYYKEKYKGITGGKDPEIEKAIKDKLSEN